MSKKTLNLQEVAAAVGGVYVEAVKKPTKSEAERLANVNALRKRLGKEPITIEQLREREPAARRRISERQSTIEIKHGYVPVGGWQKHAEAAGFVTEGNVAINKQLMVRVVGYAPDDKKHGLVSFSIRGVKPGKLLYTGRVHKKDIPEMFKRLKNTRAAKARIEEALDGIEQ